MSRVIAEAVMEYDDFKIVAQVRKCPGNDRRCAVIARIMEYRNPAKLIPVATHREFVYSSYWAKKAMTEALKDFVGRY